MPFIVLDKAFSHAWELHDRAGRNRLRVADAAGVWGLRAKSSATSQTVAALYAYGLVEVAGRGSTRQIRLSEPVARFFEDPPLSPQAEQQVITQAALKPKLIAHSDCGAKNGQLCCDPGIGRADGGSHGQATSKSYDPACEVHSSWLETLAYDRARAAGMR